MFDVYVMRRAGVRLSQEELARQAKHTGEFVLDQAHGARRLRLKSPWAPGYAPVELYEPYLVSAGDGVQRWRGYERVGEQGFVQEWYVRPRA